MTLDGKFSLTVMCCLALAACSTETVVSNDAGPQPSPPGNATCLATTPEMNATAAQSTNLARARGGLTPLRANALLADAAAAHACDMAKRGRMIHAGTTSSGPGARVKARGYRPSLTAENIAAGPYDQNQVIAEWAKSEKHMENIMIPQLREFGIGQAVGSDGKTRYWAAVYAAPR